MMLTSTKITRSPIGTFEEDVDPLDFLKRVAEEYATSRTVARLLE